MSGFEILGALFLVGVGVWALVGAFVALVLSYGFSGRVQFGDLMVILFLIISGGISLYFGGSYFFTHLTWVAQ